jgi:hypothetical protein
MFANTKLRKYPIPENKQDDVARTKNISIHFLLIFPLSHGSHKKEREAQTHSGGTVAIANKMTAKVRKINVTL